MAPELVARPDAGPVLEAWLARHGTLIDAAASAPDARPLRGRGRVLSVPAPGSSTVRWVVRHYHRGGAAARLLGDRYLRLGVPRPHREFGLLHSLRTLGVPAVEPVGAAVYPTGAVYRGDLVTVWVPDSEDLARVLFGAAQLDEVERGAAGAGTATAHPPRAIPPLEAMRSAGRLVRRLHERGVVHPDLNLKNILLVPGEGGPRALAVDVDGARIRSSAGGPARRRMLGRFERSLRKWEDRAGTPAPGGALEAFRAGYEEGEGEGGEAEEGSSSSRG